MHLLISLFYALWHNTVRKSIYIALSICNTWHFFKPHTHCSVLYITHVWVSDSPPKTNQLQSKCSHCHYYVMHWLKNYSNFFSCCHNSRCFYGREKYRACVLFPLPLLLPLSEVPKYIHTQIHECAFLYSTIQRIQRHDDSETLFHLNIWRPETHWCPSDRYCRCAKLSVRCLLKSQLKRHARVCHTTKESDLKQCYTSYALWIKLSADEKPF